MFSFKIIQYFMYYFMGGGGGVNECKKGRGEKIGVVVKLSLKGGVMTLCDGEKNYGESICFFTKLIF